MKPVSIILRLSVLLILVSFATYVDYFCIGSDGPDPVEGETLVLAAYNLIGVALAFLLLRFSGSKRGFWFWLFLVLYILSYTLPSVVSTCYFLLMMNAG